MALRDSCSSDGSIPDHVSKPDLKRLGSVSLSPVSSQSLKRGVGVVNIYVGMLLETSDQLDWSTPTLLARFMEKEGPECAFFLTGKARENFSSIAHILYTVWRLRARVFATIFRGESME